MTCILTAQLCTLMVFSVMWWFFFCYICLVVTLQLLCSFFLYNFTYNFCHSLFVLLCLCDCLCTYNYYRGVQYSVCLTRPKYIYKSNGFFPKKYQLFLRRSKSITELVQFSEIIHLKKVKSQRKQEKKWNTLFWYESELKFLIAKVSLTVFLKSIYRHYLFVYWLLPLYQLYRSMRQLLEKCTNLMLSIHKIHKNLSN